jgi:hypothetical protein
MVNSVSAYLLGIMIQLLQFVIIMLKYVYQVWNQKHPVRIYEREFK